MIIFDCDGVLVDSEILSGDNTARHMTNAGFPITSESIIQRFIGWPNQQTWDALASERGTAWPDGLVQQADLVLRERMETELQPIAGIVPALERLDIPKAVASSSGVKKLNRSLEICGLARYFGSHIYSAEQVARGKPAPDVFLLAASQLGADPAECLVVEDSAAGVNAAKRAGMRAIGFTGGKHSWPGHRDYLTKAGAVEVIAHMDDLPAALARWTTIR